MKILSTSTLSILSIACASVANAATLIQDINFGPTATDLANADVGVVKFNPALGTLQSVSLTFDVVNKFGVGLENTTASPVTLRYTLNDWTHSFSLTDASNNLLATDSDSISRPRKDVPVTAYDGATDFAGTSGFRDVFTLNFGGTSNPVNIAPFVGTGPALFLSTNTLFSLTVFGNAQSNLKSDEYMTGKLTYEYEPVPEPASLAVLATGAIALIRRRKSR